MCLFSDTDSVCFRKLKNILDHESYVYIYQGSKGIPISAGQCALGIRVNPFKKSFFQSIKLHSIKCMFTNLKDYFYYQKVRGLCPFCSLNNIFIRFHPFFNDYKQAFKNIVSLK